MGAQPNPGVEALKALAQQKLSYDPTLPVDYQAAGKGSFEPGRIVSLEDGTGTGYSARVTDANDLGAEARYGEAPVTTHHVVVDETVATQILPATSRRRQFQILNLDATASVRILLGGTSPSATDDWRLGPGETYQLPPGISFGGTVYGLADTNDAKVVAIEFT